MEEVCGDGRRWLTIKIMTEKIMRSENSKKNDKGDSEKKGKDCLNKTAGTGMQSKERVRKTLKQRIA